MAIVNIVQYNGGPDVFAWKFPNDQLSTWTQVIVNESQEAILLKGGQVADILGPGRHTLDTANIPILSALVRIPFGGRSPFTAEVWYINKVHSMSIKWGTPRPIQLQDPKYNIFIPLRSFGHFGIQIAEPKKFLVKMVGVLPVFNKDNVEQFFRGLYLTKVKDAIASYLIKKSISALEINAYLLELSDHLREAMIPIFDEYGIRLINFNINNINVPEDDPGVVKLKEALAKRAEMDIVGFTYAQERSFDTLEGAATNPGQSQVGIMGAGLGLSLGAGIGGAMSSQMGQITQNLNMSNTKKCQNCNNDTDPTARFCPHCGNDTNAPRSIGKSCMHCNAIIHNDRSRFCPECGESLTKSCPRCNSPINGSPRFCPECGESMMKTCPGCNSPIEGNPKFCPECGNKFKEN